MSRHPSPNADSPAARLKQARIAAGFKTAKHFSDTHGIGQATYHMHEAGKRSLTRSAPSYAKHLGISVGWLLTGEGEMAAFPRAANSAPPAAEVTPTVGQTRILDLLDLARVYTEADKPTEALHVLEAAAGLLRLAAMGKRP